MGGDFITSGATQQHSEMCNMGGVTWVVLRDVTWEMLGLAAGTFEGWTSGCVWAGGKVREAIGLAEAPGQGVCMVGSM